MAVSGHQDHFPGKQGAVGGDAEGFQVGGSIRGENLNLFSFVMLGISRLRVCLLGVFWVWGSLGFASWATTSCMGKMSGPGCSSRKPFPVRRIPVAQNLRTSTSCGTSAGTAAPSPVATPCPVS